MAKPIQLRFGGYGPSTTCFSQGLKRIGDRLEHQFAGEIEIKYVWNIMELGYRAEDIIWLVEQGLLTLGYQSSSYFTDRVPELGVVDLPFLFRDNATARAAFDGPLGETLARRMEANMNYRIVGWFENGFRHLSNRLRPVRRPADMAGMSIRVLPSEVHARTFEALGAVPHKWDLTEALRAIPAGTIDAQENPLANTVTYGVHNFHKFHTLTGHFYISRPIFVHRPSYDVWPQRLQQAIGEAAREAVAFQRGEAEVEEVDFAAAIKAAGCQIETLTAGEHDAFLAAVAGYRADALAGYDPTLASLLPKQ